MQRHCWQWQIFGELENNTGLPIRKSRLLAPALISTMDIPLPRRAYICHSLKCPAEVEIFYVDPYPKSLAGKHYPESIVIDEEQTVDQIPFKQFVGVAPRVYLRFFEALERKNKDGSVIKWIPEKCSMRYHHRWLAFTAKEAALGSDLQEALSKQSKSQENAL